MPTFKYALKNGKTLKLDGETMPSDNEVESIAKEQGLELLPAESKAEDIINAAKLPSIDAPTIEQPPVKQPVEQGWLSKVWHTLSDPLTTAPSRFAEDYANSIDQPSVDRSPLSAQLHGFGAGMVQGAGDLVSSATSPINLALMALSGGESTAIKAGMPRAAQLMNIGSKIAGAPIAIHGASQVADSSLPIGERATGLAEIAGGLLGMRGHTPSEVPSNIFEKSPEPTNLPMPESLPEGVVKRGDKYYKQTGVNPDTNTPTYAPIDRPISAPTFESVPVGKNIIIESGKASPELVKKARESGFEFVGLNDKGDFRFTKTAESNPSPVLESEVGSHRPTASNTREQLGPEIDLKKDSALAEAANFPRTVMASMDMSAPLRQGLGLIHKAEFWKSIPAMFKAWGSEEAFNQIQQSIADKPLFKRRNGPTGVLPSFAEDAGLKLTDLHDMSTREESMMSSWAEKVPGVRPSNRAYTAFINKLRADTFEDLINQSKIFGADAETNLPLARDIAKVINTSTGRGNMGNLENSAKALSTVLFSPRLIASRVQMMNPQYYIMLQPVARKEALKSLLAVGAAAGTFTSLMKMAGAQVESDPASSDFGKPKIGDTRFDPYGGFQQYVVAAQRLLPQIDIGGVKIGGKMKSSTTNREYNLGSPKFGQSNRADVAMRFVRGKTNPIINFAWSLLNGQKEMSGKKMDLTNINPMENSIAQRFIPMVLQDIYDLHNDKVTPPLAKVAAGTGAWFGMGSQTYGNK